MIKIQKSAVVSLLVCFGISPLLARTKHAGASVPAKPAEFTFTTSSAESRELVERAMNLFLDELEQTQAIDLLRQAVKLDPDFAFAHELLAQTSLDSSEQTSEQALAYATRDGASPAEREAIEWYEDAGDHKLIPAITKMNDLLAKYPHDRTVVWMTTWWLTTQQQYERANTIFEHSGLNNSPGLLNNAGYDYAYSRHFDKAFDCMDRYVAALPHASNPQDSYAELLRMAGRFDQAIEHYRASLAINSNFYASQYGLADTYAVKGDEVRARREYEIAFRKFPVPDVQDFLWRTREAATFVREGDFEWADRAFQTIADRAAAAHVSFEEADTYRQMAIYQPETDRALALLSKAEAAVAGGQNSNQTALQQEAAQILRARVEVAVRMKNAKIAESSLQALSAMSDQSNDPVIDLAYHGAAGALALFEDKVSDAIPHLEEDTNNPLSLKLLNAAYTKIGDKAGAQRIAGLLENYNEPTVEQAVVVPEFRQCAASSSCGDEQKHAAVIAPHNL